MNSTATHCYVGTAKCGCDVLVIADYGDKETGDSVAEGIREGYTIRRITLEEFRAPPFKFGCKCKEKKAPTRSSLFAGGAA